MKKPSVCDGAWRWNKAARSHRHIVVVLWKMIDLENNPRVAVGGSFPVVDV
jgi:hypothetical protein